MLRSSEYPGICRREARGPALHWTSGSPSYRATSEDMAGSKKDSYWAQYQSLLVRRPFFMNITQGGLITAAGNAVAQTLTEGTVKAQPLIEQVLLTMCFISPVVSMWLPYLGRLRLHWAKATAVDQVCLIGRSLGLGVGA